MTITVVVPVSPIRFHPDISILTETIESVRYWLPDAEIVITFDGVRTENELWRHNYELAINRALEDSKQDSVWHPVVPYVFDDHMHQTGMLRHVLPHITTPLMLYLESDTPLVTDEPIDWAALSDAVLSGTSNMIRLYHEAVMPSAHTHLMHGDEPGYPLIRTSQWSQRPHLASTAYYRRIMAGCFSRNAKSFIEDKMYGVVDEAYNIDGLVGWCQHRVHLYRPPGNNWKRSLNLDGRGGAPKLDEDQVF
jgi:hypothetical protein